MKRKLHLEKIKDDWIEKLEKLPLPVDEQVELLLIKKRVKPATDFKIISDIWKPWKNEKLKQINKKNFNKIKGFLENSGLAIKLGKTTIVDSPFSYEKTKGKWIPAKREEFPIFVGKDKKSLDELKKAINSGKDKALGQAYGFPKSAIAAYIGTKEKISVEDLPKDIKNKEWFPFVRFAVLSKDNWKQELKTPKLWAKIVKKHSPKLYEEFIKFVKSAA